MKYMMFVVSDAQPDQTRTTPTSIGGSIRSTRRGSA